LDNKQLISKMSEEWNAMTAADKVQFNKLNEHDKVRYEKQMKEYEKNKISSIKSEISKNFHSNIKRKSRVINDESEEDESEDDEEEDDEDDEE
jgi:hypothetical protein